MEDLTQPAKEASIPTTTTMAASTASAALTGGGIAAGVLFGIFGTAATVTAVWPAMLIILGAALLFGGIAALFSYVKGLKAKLSAAEQAQPTPATDLATAETGQQHSEAVAVQNELAATKKELETAQTEREEISTQLTKTSKDLQASKESAKDYEYKLGEAGTTINTLTNKNQELSTQLQDTNSTLRTAVAEKKEAETQLTATHAERDELTVSLEEKTTQVAELQRTLASKKSDYDASIETYNKEYTALTTEKSELSAQLTALKLKDATLRIVEKDFKELEANSLSVLQEQDTQITELRQQVAILNSQLQAKTAAAREADPATPSKGGIFADSVSGRNDGTARALHFNDYYTN